MPRKALPLAAVAPIPSLLPPPPPSPLIQLLRRDWRWAAISQFLWTFSDAFGLLDWDIEALENDFDGSETVVLPDILVKLLYALTYNRQINRGNAVDHLRIQYLKRDPPSNILGTIEEPIEWATLGLSNKVQILHDLCEWQMEDPARFRALLKNEEEAVSWRIDPIGWDKAGNTYWLFDDNRLWIQRLPPAPPRPVNKPTQKLKRGVKRPREAMPSETDVEPSTSSSKGRRFPAKGSRQSHRKRGQSISPELTPISSDEDDMDVKPLSEEVVGPRKRTKVEFYGNVTPTAAALSRSGNLRNRIEPSTGSGSKITRSNRIGESGLGNGVGTPSKSSSNQKTHQRGRLSDIKTPMKPVLSPLARNGSSSGGKASLPRGTRVSRRLRDVEDEWQQIPDEWLSPDVNKAPQATSKAKVPNGKVSGQRNAKGTTTRTDEDDDDSALSELSGNSDLSSLTDEDVHEESSRVLRLRGGAGSDVAFSPAPEDGAEAVEVLEAPLEVAATPEESDDQLPLKNGVSEESGPANGSSMPMDGTMTYVEDAQQPQMEQDTEEGKPEIETSVTAEVKTADEEASNSSPGFVEWEAICVTLYDWRTFPETFATSTHPDEKAFYKLLVDSIAPQIIDVLVVKEQERIKQEAVNNRKRSSRIAIKELEREEQLRHEQARQEMEERMNKMRQEEKRRSREEAAAAAAEKMREDRLRERELRMAQREEVLFRKLEEENREKERAEEEREQRARRRLEGGSHHRQDSEEGKAAGDFTGSAVGIDNSSKPSGRNGQKNGNANGEEIKESWELACEICKVSGWNLDDDSDVVACEDCGRWQHTACHDLKDAAKGRRSRNWDQVEFKCKQCRRRINKELKQGASPKSPRKSKAVVNGGEQKPHARKVKNYQPLDPQGSTRPEVNHRPSLDHAATQLSEASSQRRLSQPTPSYPQAQYRAHPAQNAYIVPTRGPSNGPHPSSHPQYTHPQQQHHQHHLHHLQQHSQSSHAPQPPPQSHLQQIHPHQAIQPHQQTQQLHGRSEQSPQSSQHSGYPAYPQSIYPPRPPHQSYPTQAPRQTFVNAQPQPSQYHSPQMGRPPHSQTQMSSSGPSVYRAPAHISQSTIPHSSSHPFGPGPVARLHPNQEGQMYDPRLPPPDSRNPSIVPGPFPNQQSHQARPSQSPSMGGAYRPQAPPNHSPTHQNGVFPDRPHLSDRRYSPEKERHNLPNRIHLPPIQSLPLGAPARQPGSVGTPPITLPPMQSSEYRGIGN